jgi:DNA-binding PadR family transcriptional regulator
MSRRRVSNPLALAVLGSLTERPMHPYEISQTLRSRGKEESIKLNYGSLYSVVQSLTKRGLIEVKEVVREGRRPERTVYAITAAGVDEYEDWLAELLSTPTREYTSLEAGLSLIAGLPPDEVARLLDVRAQRLRIQIGSVAASNSVARDMDLPEVFIVESVFREAMLGAELEFVQKLAADIRSGRLAGTPTWRHLHELRDQGVSWEEVFADPIGYLGEEGRILLRDDVADSGD